MSFRSRVRKLEVDFAGEALTNEATPRIVGVVVESREQARWTTEHPECLQGNAILPADLPSGRMAYFTFAEFATALRKAKKLPAADFASLPDCKSSNPG